MKKNVSKVKPPRKPKDAPQLDDSLAVSRVFVCSVEELGKVQNELNGILAHGSWVIAGQCETSAGEMMFHLVRDPKEWT